MVGQQGARYEGHWKICKTLRVWRCPPHLGSPDDHRARPQQVLAGPGEAASHHRADARSTVAGEASPILAIVSAVQLVGGRHWGLRSATVKRQGNLWPNEQL